VPQRLGRFVFSTGSLVTGNILRRAKSADLPVRQVMLIVSIELIDQ